METEIYKAVLKRIKEHVTDFRWIDSNEGQLTSIDRSTLVFPACLIEMSYPSCRDLSKGEQQVLVEFRLSCAFEILGSGNALAPKSAIEQTISYMKTLQKLHQCLQWWQGEGRWMPMKRIRVLTSINRAGLRVIEAIYQLEYIDGLDAKG